MATVEAKHEAERNGHEPAPRIAVENPATGEVIGHVPDMGADEVAALVERARAAQPAWEALGYEGRGEVMYELRRWMVEHRDRVLGTIVAENGKPREEALLHEFVYICDALGHWAKNARKLLADERVRPHSALLFGRKVVVRRRPHGVVGVISPWNFPLALSIGDAIPALMAGNSVVMKPSELTPLITMLIVEEGMRAAGLPEDACLVATGAGGAGAALVEHVDMVMFTGSTAVGRKVAARAGERLIPCSLELGGKDPMIVLRDADVEGAATTAVQWAYGNSGQICMSIERVYVEEPVYDEFVDKVVERTRAIRQGAPSTPGAIDVGAMTMPKQVDIVDRHVRDAVERGARVLTGGGRKEGPGRFFEPTVLVDVDHSMACMREETFGPTMAVMKVRDVDEAVRLANDTNYGLNSSVFTRDLEKGEQVARRIEAGNVCVNDALLSFAALEAPFAGAKESGIGARHGADGIRKYTHPQTILVTRFGMTRDMTAWPNTRLRSKLLEGLVALMWGRRRRRRS
jgi:acyl-CoA reductase-like NAD-dependent aldehyde dehydrogenase